MTVTELPTNDWAALAETEPWWVVADAIVYERAGAELPDDLDQALTEAAMYLAGLALRELGNSPDWIVRQLCDREWSANLWFNIAAAEVGIRVEWEPGDDTEPTEFSVVCRGGGAGEALVRYIEDRHPG